MTRKKLIKSHRRCFFLHRNTISQIKTKLRRACENYSKICVPFKYKQVINDLSKNDNIVIMEQDRGRKIVIMDKTNIKKKWLALLNAEFVKSNKDLIKQIKALRTIKTNIHHNNIQDPTGSSPGKFYGTVKIHQLSPTDNMEQLLMWPIVFKINSPTCQLGKYLAKLLSPLSQLDCTINSSKDFIEQIKYDNIPEGYQVISFDVRLLFTSIALSKAMEITLERIYYRKEIKADILKL